MFTMPSVALTYMISCMHHVGNMMFKLWKRFAQELLQLFMVSGRNQLSFHSMNDILAKLDFMMEVALVKVGPIPRFQLRHLPPMLAGIVIFSGHSV